MTRVVSSGPGIGNAATILLEEAPGTPVTSQARALVVERLEGRGYQQSQGGALQLQVAFAERDAAIGVTTKAGEAVLDVAPAKPKKPLQSCADREMRLTVTLTRIADGTELYRGSASEYHCKAQPQDVVPALVNAALDDLGSPKGAYRVTRRGLE